MVSSARLRGIKLVWAVVFLFLIPLKDTHPSNAQTEYESALKLFQQGRLVNSQLEAHQGYEKFRMASPKWAARFKLLEAQSMVGLGMYDDSLQTLASLELDKSDPKLRIGELYTEASALTHQKRISEADQRLSQAEILCRSSESLACGYVERTQGLLAVEEGDPDMARSYFMRSLTLARDYDDRFLEASTSVNLGLAAMHSGHFDESLDWSQKAYQAAHKLDAENIEQIAEGNLGWAYYQLGDNEKALDQFLKAEKSAVELGNLRFELKWTSTAGNVYQDTGDLTRAASAYQKELDLAKKLKSKEDIENALEELARISFESGKLNEADAYLAQVIPMEQALGTHPSASVQLTQGMLAATRRQDREAEQLFRAIEGNHQNPTTTRLNAGDQLARLLELEGNLPGAERRFKSILKEFESERSQLKNDESKLPFVAIAANIYDDYIQLLVKQNRVDEALVLADQSRARTLAESLGVAMNKQGTGAASIEPHDLRSISRKTGATLFFYWLGTDQSYLWAITPTKIALFQLPAQDKIAARIERYNKAILDLQDPLKASSEDGQELYKMLVAPASGLIDHDATIIILAEGALTQLNFETLLAPGPSSEIGLSHGSASPALHYWIEDATLLSAPSLAMLAAAKSPRTTDRKLLLLGNPVTVSEDYPSLPLFGLEMKEIQKHFQPRETTVFSGFQASPATYLSSNPAGYSYIHFVSHATASRTDPLDSAIILSSPVAGDSTFKLYARDIMQHPIDARLVTVSACYTSGTRAYAGEGLVGLSWAFLRAGAQNVIGALWEASDDSSPRLMDTLYQGIENGKTPAVALRLAKLSLIHAGGSFSKPFYWAPFQLYTR